MLSCLLSFASALRLILADHLALVLVRSSGSDLG